LLLECSNDSSNSFLEPQGILSSEKAAEEVQEARTRPMLGAASVGSEPNR